VIFPRVIIIAGPNGAGKTTFATEFLPHEADCRVFVNADLIAAGLSPFAPERAAILAGRLMLKAIAEHAQRHESFAFETTLSGLSYARQIPDWRKMGYRVEMFFLSLPSADAAVARVAERVRQGGHAVPEDVVRRRFASGRRLFEAVYRPLVDHWALYDNSGDAPVLMEWSGKMNTRDTAGESRPAYGELPPDADADLKGSLQAMQRAASRARDLALRTGTDLIIVRDGKVVRIKPQTSAPPV
jgi:predicted ABC-type ATPase